IAQDEEPTAIVASIGEGDTNISFWNGLTGSDGVTLNEMLVDFVAANPEISVTTEIIPWNTLYTKLQAAFVAGTPPDVFLLHAADVPQFAGYVVLNALGLWYTSGGGRCRGRATSGMSLNGMNADGTVYGIPLDNNGRALWITGDMFEACRLAPARAAAPTT